MKKLNLTITFLLLSFMCVQFVNAQNLAGGVEPHTQAEYNSLPKDYVTSPPLRAPNYTDPDDELNPDGSSGVRGKYLIYPLPTAGDQGNTLSCLGWALSTAVGIMANYEYNDWEKAKRSPSFVYNLLDPGSNCSYTNIVRGVRLLDSIGVCSYNSMPYIAGNCSAQPGDLQYLEAEMHKTSGWKVAADSSSSSYIRKNLDLGYPMVITFPVTPSFDSMWNTSNSAQKGVWDKYSPNESSRGLHAACIVGYEVYEETDAYGRVTESDLVFKVMNFWGTGGGKNGYFDLPAETVEKGALRRIYRPTGVNVNKILGGKLMDRQAEYTYEMNYCPLHTYVEWSCSPNLELTYGQGSDNADFYPVKSGYGFISAKLSRGNASLSLHVDSIYIDIKDYKYVISPNPASDYIKISIVYKNDDFSKPGKITIPYKDLYTVQIYDERGTLLKQEICDGGSRDNFSITYLRKNKTYFVRIILKGGVILPTQQLIVQ